YTDNETEATGHSWDEGTVTTEATCSEDGVKTYTCTVCGKTKTEKIEATGHSYEAVVTEPTCTEKGYTTYTCKVCGDSYKADETDATGHTSDEAVKENEVAATCTTDGSYDSVVYCTVCGGELSRDIVTLPATGHSFGEWETITSPTCEDSGSEQRTCSVCQYAENRSLDAAGHDWEEDYTVDQEAACTTDGSRSIHCKNCEAVKDSEVIPATGHNWDEGIVTAEAACEETGLMLYTCTVCQETKTEIITASGHILTHVVSNAATCTGEGNIEYWYCEDCGKYFSDEMAETEISFADTVIPATGHSYGEWETVISPTCEDTGSEKRSCTACGYTETRDVEPAGHDWEEDYTVDVEAGCTTDGSKSIHCRNCAAVKDSEVIPATGHSYEAVVTEPTYTEQGYTVYTCTNCGDSYITDYTAIKVIDGTDENLSTKTLVQELTAVPEGLKSLYSSVDELISELISRVTVGTGYTAENALVYDVVLQYRINGGEWINATVDNFPATGITVTLPYPEGTDSSYEFTVLHMFTETSSRLGITAGGTETPTITKSDDGLVVTLTGLSPVAVFWKEAEEETEETETEASTESAETESAAAESETTATESESESETNASPQTGDNTPFETWLSVLILSAAVILLMQARRKKME
ncbi:MAG: hypothetical protein LUH53_06910, partial [Lachnospiraceae bacterium]|nr:hypothetical protein [Lachnospiraceae bacterium]